MFCVHCKGNHDDTGNVLACAENKRANAHRRVAAVDLGPTASQVDFIAALAKKKGVTVELNENTTRSSASRIIAYLKRQPDYTPERPPAAVIAYQIVNMIKPGRYAVTIGLGDEQRYVFFRVSRPTQGKLAGCLQVQTQHGETLTRRLVFSPTGDLLYQNDRKILGADIGELLTLVVVDQQKAALDYGREMGQCSRCGRELTDERSRWYSIGPECEKQWLSMIEYVNELHGIFGGE